ncbi:MULTISPECIES: GntR family transcriptional regulator [Paenibacillus]|uniref:GntR family transcriptional regulator n=1 Tax=Paenibacillus naphthalenovorans TaxID=162209 RepID=A0A0U2VC37_9BACL|nr:MULTISPECIES: GntR family transcriptional regulator [Paenibacillus]ALS21123.1 GntR family transcriptional regulator [Paenibacillus naphthalenovorans]NTZ18650.1 GntR family transcriptional regulator [Paenibacillus sp. JMULE4]GCL71139.1 GntR family transcriptional regulator [Paenibacillus naphthalenovorans]SDI02502.1 DNA-binding transcriptional regulator, GntR family [Paenibacillus naphthalenovorans]
MGGQTDIAFQYIKEKILTGVYKPSQKLTENQLAEAIGVSRNTIKKALMMLERENLVEVENNKGATIKSFTLEEVINYMEIREVLEGLVAKSAAKNISEADIKRLENILETMNSHIKENRFDEYSLLNREFHNVIYNASKNVQAISLINTIKTQLNRIHFKTILVPGRNQQSFIEHERILQALKSHNEKEAEEAIKNHVANVRQTIAQNYQYLL